MISRIWYDTANCLLPCGSGLLTTPALGPLNAAFPVEFDHFTAEQKINWFGTVRGRLGYAHGTALFYFTGGLAYAEVERRYSAAGSTIDAFGVVLAPGDVFNSFAGGLTAKSVKMGWTIGGGAEAQLAGGWTAKVEYLYMDLGSVTDTVHAPYTFCAAICAAGDDSGSGTFTADLRQHIFRVGLNYRFGAHQVAARW